MGAYGFNRKTLNIARVATATTACLLTERRPNWLSAEYQSRLRSSILRATASCNTGSPMGSVHVVMFTEQEKLIWPGGQEQEPAWVQKETDVRGSDFTMVDAIYVPRNRLTTNQILLFGYFVYAPN